MAVTGENPFPTSSGSSTSPGVAASERARDDVTATQSATSAMAPNATPPSTTAGDGSMPGSGSDMLGSVVQGAHATIDRLAQSVEPTVRKLQDGVGARSEHMRELGDEWAESLRCTVRDNPLAAVATALALGVLIARLTHH